jgi:hypothetical protein
VQQAWVIVALVQELQNARQDLGLSVACENVVTRSGISTYSSGRLSCFKPSSVEFSFRASRK